MPRKRRLPYAPFEAAIGRVITDQATGARRDPDDVTSIYGRDEDHTFPYEVLGHQGIVSELTGVNRRMLQRWKHTDGGIPEDRADEMACAIGLHPSEIWPEWNWEPLLWPDHAEAS